MVTPYLYVSLGRSKNDRDMQGFLAMHLLTTQFPFH